MIRLFTIYLGDPPEPDRRPIFVLMAVILCLLVGVIFGTADERSSSETKKEVKFKATFWCFVAVAVAIAVSGISIVQITPKNA